MTGHRTILHSADHQILFSSVDAASARPRGVDAPIASHGGISLIGLQSSQLAASVRNAPLPRTEQGTRTCRSLRLSRSLQGVARLCGRLSKTWFTPDRTRRRSGAAFYDGAAPHSCVLRVLSNRNQVRRSPSSIQFSRKLAVATSPYPSQSRWVTRISRTNIALSSRSSASISCAVM